MTLIFNSANINKVYIGDSEVSAMYLGDIEVFSKEVPVETWTLNLHFISNDTSEVQYVQTPNVGEEYRKEVSGGMDSFVCLYFTGGNSSSIQYRGAQKFTDEADASVWYDESTGEKLTLNTGNTQNDIFCGSNYASITFVEPYVLNIEFS